jgi:hypothetical protein
MNFHSTVHDNWAGGGGVNTDDMVVTEPDTGTPFALTAPNGGESLSGTTTVTWTVGGRSRQRRDRQHSDVDRRGLDLPDRTPSRPNSLPIPRMTGRPSCR